MRETVETTYADLRPTDLVVDKSGKAWPISDLDFTREEVVFWILDPVSKVRRYFLGKPTAHSVTVSRVQFEDPVAMVERKNEETRVELERLQEVAKEIGGEVEITYTEREADAAKAATDDQPVRLPAFEDMTILEMRSHLYLLHGVYAHDMKSRVDTIRMHADAHFQNIEGKLASRHVPHVHEVK